jgi:hypothetical protein
MIPDGGAYRQQHRVAPPNALIIPNNPAPPVIPEPGETGRMSLGGEEL